MLQHEYKEDIPPTLPIDTNETQETEKSSSEEHQKQNPNEISNIINDFDHVDNIKTGENNDAEKVNDSWLEFFSKDTTVLNVDEMLVKDIKKEGIDYTDLEAAIDTSIISRTNESNTNDSILYDQLSITPDCTDYKINEPAEDLPSEILNQSVCSKKRIVKYIDPATGKIYYLEMDRDLDLTKVQEIVINSQGNVKTAKISPIKSNGLKHVRNSKHRESLLRPEVRSLIKKEMKTDNYRALNNYPHIENDHCYLAAPRYDHIDTENEEENDEEMPMENRVSVDNVISTDGKDLYETLCGVIRRFSSVRIAANYLLKKIPLITDKAKEPDYVKYFPFVVENDEKYWKLDFAKRRNIEWSRAKLINKLLKENLRTDEQIWRTKQILIYSRLHGFYPIRTENIPQHLDTSSEEWSIWNSNDDSRQMETEKSESCPNFDFNTLTLFDSEELLGNTSLLESVTQSDSDEEIDIVGCETKVKVKSEVVPETSLEVLPVESEEDRLRFMFIEKKCADIGIELRNEDIGNGYSYSAVHAVLLSAVRSFAEELLRSGLAASIVPHTVPGSMPLVWTERARVRAVCARAVRAALSSAPRLQLLSARGLAALPHTTQPL
ncbi:unnamed protein product [Parnassius apollo]|nr:unnamed protein product [Parnassius apollo]